MREVWLSKRWSVQGNRRNSWRRKRLFAFVIIFYTSCARSHEQNWEDADDCSLPRTAFHDLLRLGRFCVRLSLLRDCIFITSRHVTVRITEHIALMCQKKRKERVWFVRLEFINLQIWRHILRCDIQRDGALFNVIQQNNAEVRSK